MTESGVLFWMYILIPGKHPFELLQTVPTIEECFVLAGEVLSWPIPGERPLGVEIRVGCTVKFPATREG